MTWCFPRKIILKILWLVEQQPPKKKNNKKNTGVNKNHVKSAYELFLTVIARFYDFTEISSSRYHFVKNTIYIIILFCNNWEETQFKTHKWPHFCHSNLMYFSWMVYHFQNDESQANIKSKWSIYAP